MAWKPTTEDWRLIARTAAHLAMAIDAEIEDDDEDAPEVDAIGVACGRAAELLVQSGLDHMDVDAIAELEHETAVLIATGGMDGWNAAREALKRADVMMGDPGPPSIRDTMERLGWSDPYLSRVCENARDFNPGVPLILGFPLRGVTMTLCYSPVTREFTLTIIGPEVAP